jgi:glycosyltransferase involved in cell wall biosynthesis
MVGMPKVVLVGGIDVDARIELMRCLSNDFELSALGSLEALYESFSKEGFKYSTYNLGRGANPLQDIITIIQLFFIFRKQKPQLVHTFDTKPCVWARIAARLAGVPVVMGTLPGLGSLYGNDSLFNSLVRAVYEKLQQYACHISDLTMFQNSDDAHQFIDAGVVPAKKVIIVPGSGVATERFSPEQVPEAKRKTLRAELGLRSDEIVVTMVSRLIRSKGVLEFATAARNIRCQYPDVRFLLVGPVDNDSMDRLNPAEIEQVKQSVTWTGPRRDIPEILAMSNIFVLPSTYREGIPRVLLEAASMGLPIVTTNSPGCNEVVENGFNGYLVPAHDPNALSQAIERLVKQPELRTIFGHFSRQLALERFDLTVIAEQIREAYQQKLASQS